MASRENAGSVCRPLKQTVLRLSGQTSHGSTPSSWGHQATTASATLAAVRCAASGHRAYTVMDLPKPADAVPTLDVLERGGDYNTLQLHF